MTDCRGLVHCVDADTGAPYWTTSSGATSGAPRWCDGKVYVAHGRDFCIFAASKEKQVLFATEFDAPINSTPVAANGVLYVATLRQLYAIAETPEVK